MRKTTICAALLLSAMIVTAGCGTKGGMTEAGGAIPTDAVTMTPVPSSSAASSALPDSAADGKVDVKLYYADANTEKLIESTRALALDEETKYVTVLQALSTAEEADQTSLFKGFDFKKAELKEGQLTIDLSFADESRLGSGGEALLLQALEYTLFQFPEVKSIEVLVNGQQEGTLMGHVELEHPIQRKE